MVESRFLSNTRGYPSYVIGVGALITTNKIAHCGLKAGVLSNPRTNSLDLLCEHLSR